MVLALLAALATPPQAPPDTAYFAGGCFWGIEAVFEHLKGVTNAESGYAGGTRPNPSYREVGTGRTGHAESVRVIYDPAQISYAQLLEIFFTLAHDPTQLNMQGPDVGTEYRSIAFFKDSTQKASIDAYIAKLTAARVYKRKIVTEVVPLVAFYRAEEYHQDYLVNHPYEPYIVYNDAPKLEALRRRYPALYQKHE
jgi:peptide-methionine (S)-S-oxide reductase